ncbi:MAG TPA: DNA polymerase III subunit epsilon [Ghiorsea sp.]|nr:DNA polymerase III subunit epsilon [Ghiorsea sp.]HIP07494.1 DNA polymerase III subunit epsilon [Mariprofundaceae bacterium]
MRLIMLDTETTGLSPQNGDKMVEIGAIEVRNRDMMQTRTFHQYLNPERNIPNEVVRIHGIDNARVKDEPTFKDVAQDFLDFIQGGTLVIHNAPFDLGFIMAELESCGLPNIYDMPVIDTLVMARKQFPRQRNNLDALCDRFEVERGHRDLHGALLDSELLGEVYLAMTGGKQFSLGMDTGVKPASEYVQLPSALRSQTEQKETAILVRRASPKIRDEDLQRHQTLMQRITKESGQQPLWKEG